MPQADIVTYFILVEKFLYWFILVYLFVLLYCYLDFFNNIKFYYIRRALDPINKLKIVTF